MAHGTGNVRNKSRRKWENRALMLELRDAAEAGSITHVIGSAVLLTVRQGAVQKPWI
jgi:hypothetical protein